MEHEETSAGSSIGKSDITTESFIVLLFSLLVVALIFHRIHYGVDFTDESFYVALAYRFATGDQPFVDEYNLAQVSGALLSPFISAFLAFNNGQSDGIILFVRYLHLLFSALVAWTVFLSLRRQLAWSVALLVSFVAIVFTPLALHSISYITLGSGFFTLGCFLGLWSVKDFCDRRLPLMAGIAHGLAVISYPTLIIPCLCSLMLTTRRYPREMRFHNALFFCIGGGLVGVFPAVILLRAGYANVETALAYVFSFGPQGGNAQKFIAGAQIVWDNFPHKVAVAVGMVGIFILRRQDRAWTNRLLFSMVLIITLALTMSPNLWTSTALPVESLHLVLNIGLIGPILACFLWEKELTRHLVWFVWVPSFIAGLAVCWSSGNGARMAAVGMVPAAIASLVLLALIVAHDDIFQTLAGTRIRAAVIIALVLSVFLGNQFVGIYRDDPLENLNVEIQAGPYKGIFTTKARDAFLSVLTDDITALSKPQDRILFFDDFPAGYLMSNLRPATPTVWLNPTSAYPTVDRTINEKYYRRRGIQPDVVVMLKKFPLHPNHLGLTYPATDPLIRFVRLHYRKAVSKDEYEVYVKCEHCLPTQDLQSH